MYDPAVMAKEHVCSPSVFCSLALALGCATAPPLAESPSVAPPPEDTSRPPQPPTVQPQRPGDATNIPDPDALVGLCQALRDVDTVDFQGNPVERARALDERRDRRRAALAASYVTVIPAAGFSFRTYQMSERRLVLDTDHSLALGDGAELFVSSAAPAPGFALAPDLADQLLAERSAGRMALRLVFRPARSELRKDGCLWLGGGRVVKMEIDIAAAALLDAQGNVLARADGGDLGDPNAGPPVRSPRVSVRKPRGPDGRDLDPPLAAALRPLATAAQLCYENVLLVRPALRGTIVLAVRVGAGGKIEEAHVEMSSLADDAVSACVVSAAKKTSLPGLGQGQRVSAPLQFASADEL